MLDEFEEDDYEYWDACDCCCCTGLCDDFWEDDE